MDRKKLRKAFAGLLLSVVAAFFLPTVAFANVSVLEKEQSETDIAPYMTYIEEWENSLTFSGNTASVDCWVSGDVLNATKAKVVAELQLKSGSSWIAYGTWTETANTFKASVYETKSVKTGQTYRVKATFTVWEGSQSESIVVFTDEVTA